jgi:hypothetical protein
MKKTIKKIADVAVLITDLMPGVLAILAGAGLIVGGATGVLWY